MGKVSKKGKITDIVLQKDKRPPILVYFENGDVNPKDSESIKFNIHRASIRKDRMVSTVCGGVAYRGTCKSNQIRKFLAIRNKTTNEVKLVEAAVCNLSPLFEKKSIAKVEMSKVQLKGELAKAYGTKARMLRAVLAETLTIDTKIVESAAAKISTEKEATPNKSECTFTILPPHNRKASKIQEVYKIEDIITPDIESCFEAEVEKLLDVSTDDLKTQGFSEYFITTWNSLKNRHNPEKRAMDLKCLLYIECLGVLLHANRANLKKSDFSMCYFSETLNDYLLEIFTGKSVNGRLFSPAQKDQAISYLLVICFLIFDYELNISSFVKVTNSSLTRLKLLCRVIGAKVDKNGKATLSLPLGVPPVSRPKSRKST